MPTTATRPTLSGVALSFDPTLTSLAGTVTNDQTYCANNPTDQAAFLQTSTDMTIQSTVVGMAAASVQKNNEMEQSIVQKM